MSFLSEICGILFSTKFNLTRHTQTFHLNKTFDCKHREKDINTKQKLRKHKPQCEPNYCKFCYACSEQPLHEHIKMCHEDEKFQCRKYQKKFTNKRNFKQHKCKVNICCCCYFGNWANEYTDNLYIKFWEKD